MPAILATSGLSSTLTVLLALTEMSLLDTSLALLPTLMDVLYLMPAQAAMAPAVSVKAFTASSALLAPPVILPQMPLDAGPLSGCLYRELSSLASRLMPPPLALVAQSVAFLTVMAASTVICATVLRHGR